MAQSDLTLIEMLWWDLKRAVHEHVLPTSMNWGNVKKSGPRFLIHDVTE